MRNKCYSWSLKRSIFERKTLITWKKRFLNNDSQCSEYAKLTLNALYGDYPPAVVISYPSPGIVVKLGFIRL